jgi:hypothetical protein
VHAVVEPPDVAERCHKPARNALPRAAERVEQPHLDMLERREAREHRIGTGRVEIVDEQPHAHPAQRGIAQAAHEKTPGAIVLDQVVLHVERRPRAPDELDARVERVGPERHEPESAQ